MDFVYVAADDRFVRYSGRANRRLDLLVEARAVSSRMVTPGVTLFLGTGKVRGAFVLQSTAEPSNEEMFPLHLLAEPTGAALATTVLTYREGRQARELRLGEARAGSNRTMAATIVRLSAHQHIRDSILAQIVQAVSVITRRQEANRG